jgi:hypothetical protein
MARPIDLGLILEGKDLEEFWEDRKNPKATKEQILMFKMIGMNSVYLGGIEHGRYHF